MNEWNKVKAFIEFSIDHNLVHKNKEYLEI